MIRLSLLGNANEVFAFLTKCIPSCILFLMIGFSDARADNPQQILDREISIDSIEIALEEVLHEIEHTAGVKFAYSIDHLNIHERITIQVKNKSLRYILDELFKPRNIQYIVHEKNSRITLKRKTSPDSRTSIDTPHSDNPSDQPIKITGTVRESSTMQPMPGVNILLKGTSTGTITTSEGTFSIEARENDILVFSFIGYITREIRIMEQSVIDVVLVEDAQTLKEVVINAGYYEVSDRERTGNISRVEATDIQKQPVSNPLAALQGRVPGLEIIQQSGVPGSNFQVRIRGTNSIANGNDPLYIIDGVPFTSSSLSMTETSGLISGPGGFSPMNAVNPNDIESIEVLKDADATAIYGSRGSNGVIIITTKRGRKGSTNLELNFYTGAGKVTRKMDLLSTDQYLQMRHEAFANDNVAITPANARDLLSWDTTRYTDWQNELIGGTAHTTDAQLSLSGGNADTQFSIGAGFHKESTVFPGNNDDARLAIHSNITHTAFNQKLKATLAFNVTVANTNLLRQDLTNKALTLPSIAPPIYNDQGDLNWEGWTAAYENPLAYTKRIYESTSNNFIGSGVLQYSLLPNLTLKANLGYTILTNNAITTSPLSSKAPDVGLESSTTFSNSDFENWIAEPQINWTPKLGQGQFDVLIGSTFLSQSNSGLAQTGTGFSSEALMKNLSSAERIELGTDYYSQYRYQAVFGRINYNWKHKYIINLTGRRDGSSRFGPGKQYAMFGAVGTAWIFSEEQFIKNNASFLSFGKLRASYGVTGNDQLGDYQYLDSYSSSAGPYQQIIGLGPDRLSNPDFAWETNHKLEVGIDLAFFKDRINTSLSAYRNRSSNQLVGFPLPLTTGFSSIQGNFPATVQNQGVEIELTTTNIQTSSFNWVTSFNISVSRNTLVDFPNLQAFPAYANRYVVGQPLSIRKVYHHTGMDSGIYTFDDVNQDGIYNVDDRTTIRFVGRDFYGGLNNSFQYKGFQLDVLFQFVKQTGYNYVTIFSTPGILLNQPTEVLSRWKQEGDQSSIQRFGQTGEPVTAYARLAESQSSIGDASFIRLKNISLSWTLPALWIQKARLENARLFIQGQNLLTLTSYKGLDPETQGGSQLPPLRILTIGIHLSL